MKFGTFANPATALILAAVVLFGTLGAEAAVVDYVGYAWENGGIDPSNPGDQLAIATVVTQIDPLFNVDLDAQEGTLYIDGLTSLGSVLDPSTGATTIQYSGGTLSVFSGPARNHDWGTNPANGTVPSTFIDGDLVFAGTFINFRVILQPSGLGVFEGYLNGTGGSALAGPCSNCAYTFSGSFTAPTGANIPAGYDMQVDGILELESAVPTETMSFGSLKQLFR